MNADSTFRDLIESVRKAPCRFLDIRLSSIGRSVWLVGRLLLIVAAYVAVVLALGKILSFWWKPPTYVYVIAFVMAPLRYIIEWQRERKKPTGNNRSLKP
jgi:hypothetical protein